MEEAISLIIQGCNLGKNLESSLGSLANQPGALYRSCDEIVRTFTAAKERLMIYVHHQMLLQQQQNVDPNLQELLRSSTSSSAMELLHQAQVFAGMGNLESQTGGVGIGSGRPVLQSGGGDVGQGMDSGRSSSSSSQRSGRRKEVAGRWIERVPAPQVGNTEIPPEDGFTWRKYGQKEILGSRFPRSYFRCTHQKLYNCSAKKQVQRLDNDPFTYEVTYRGEHTCHMTATAPSVPPPPPPPPQFSPDQLITQAVTAAHQPLARLLEFSLGGGVLSGSTSSAAAGSSSGAGPSTQLRYGKELEYPISDMADVMFNSGSSSTNSMELIFNSMEDRREPSDHDKKN